MLWIAMWLGCTEAEVPPDAPAPAPVTQDPGKAASQRSAAMTAYHEKDWAGCSDRFTEALTYGAEDANQPYNAACCAALAGRTDEAFARLQSSASMGYSEAYHLVGDSDLSSLHADARWEALLAQVEAAQDARIASINGELYDLFVADQEDRQLDEIDWGAVGPRDKARQARVAEILSADGAKASIDFYHAAMVYQHGSTVEDTQKAHDLAIRALTIDPPHEPARWLAAASEDRVLMRQGKPQKWGTQFEKETPESPWRLYPVDPSVTDEERSRWNVPSLAEAQAHVAQMNDR